MKHLAIAVLFAVPRPFLVMLGDVFRRQVMSVAWESKTESERSQEAWPSMGKLALIVLAIAPFLMLCLFGGEK